MGLKKTDQQAIETLLDLAEKYGSRSRHAVKEGTGSVKDTRGGGKVQSLEKSLRVCHSVA